MTWGQLGATPLRVEAEDFPTGIEPDRLGGPSFRVPENTKRDNLGRALGQQVGALPLLRL